MARIPVEGVDVRPIKKAKSKSCSGGNFDSQTKNRSKNGRLSHPLELPLFTHSTKLQRPCSRDSASCPLYLTSAETSLFGTSPRAVSRHESARSDCRKVILQSRAERFARGFTAIAESIQVSYRICTSDGGGVQTASQASVGEDCRHACMHALLNQCEVEPGSDDS